MSFTDIITPIEFASIIAGLIYIGRKLQILDDMKITLDKVKANLKVVTGFLMGANIGFNPSELQEYSPLRLAPKGEDLIASFDFLRVFQEHKADFFDYIDGEEPKLKYDVELAAIRSVFLLADKEYMNFLKIFFYNHPSRNMNNTAPTLGVYIRDKYLAEHPGIVE